MLFAEIAPIHWFVDDVKAAAGGAPSSTVALMPVEKGGTNSSTRLLPLSATHTFPCPSTATPVGLHNVAAVGGGVAPIPRVKLAPLHCAASSKFECPMTTVAAIPMA